MTGGRTPSTWITTLQNLLQNKHLLQWAPPYLNTNIVVRIPKRKRRPRMYRRAESVLLEAQCRRELPQ